MSDILTTEEMLKSLSARVRVASGDARQCSDHMAIHSSLTYAEALHHYSVILGEMADKIREVANAH